MDKNCDLDKLYERKHPRESMPLKECAECLFNVLCNDYIIHEESNDWVQEMSENYREEGK